MSSSLPPPAAESVLHFHAEPPGLTRRRAMSLLAASMALATGACRAPPDGSVLPFVHGPAAGSAGGPRHYASAVLRDGFAMGVLLATVDGRPIKVEGHPLHPSSLGGSDALMQAAVLQLWDPDRSMTVMERLAEGGPPAASTWAAFETAWRAREAQLVARQGEGLRLLTGPLTSPTALALLRRCLQRFPRARWHVHAPLRDAQAAAGVQSAFGRPLAPLWRLREARCVLSLGGDPFSDGPGALRQALDWSQARAAGRDAGRLPRCFALEVTPGLFGARADRRLARAPQRIEAVLRQVAGALMAAQPTSAPLDADETAFAQTLVQALREAGPDALVIPGRGLSADAHALALALNQRLGAVGRTLQFIEPPDAAPEAGSLPELVQALDGGAVDTLFVIDSNPAYDAPGALGVERALGRAAFSAHAGLHADETAAACRWHLPLSHEFEQWADARAFDGTATLLQPAILPLYDSRSAIELLALLAGATERSGHALLQAQWRGQAAATGGVDAGFDAFWRASLRQGFVAGSAFAPQQPAQRTQAASAAASRPSPPPPSSDATVVLAFFIPDPVLRDGRLANLGWLQELPRPFTQHTWDNAGLIGPATAARLHLATGDRVRAQVQGRSLDLPVSVSERQAEGTLALPLGQGRRRAGRVGSGVGFDAFALLPTDTLMAPVQLQRLGTRHEFAVTQHTLERHDREVARTADLHEHTHEHEHPSLYPPRPAPAHAWAMVIDLDACIGCKACTVACQAENNIPVVGKDQVARGREMHWIRVDQYDAPELGHNTVFQPVPCMHCEHAPCELVCPVGATVHDRDGLNVQVYNRCVGTRFCSNNCPYKVRRFNFLQYADTRTESLKGQRNPDVTVRQRGVMEKCSYCIHRIERAQRQAQAGAKPLADGDVVTACQAACPTQAIHFGDLALQGSEVQALRASPRHHVLLEELNTRPRTTYLARVKPAADGS